MSYLSEMKAKYSNQGGNTNNNTSKMVAFYNWKDGDNIIRLVGKPIMTRTYYLPMSSFNKIDIFKKNAFDKENNKEFALPKVINSPNWDIENETFVDNGDVLLSLNRISNEMIKVGTENGLPPEEIDKWRKIRNKTIPTLQYKFLCLDRDMPYVIEDGKIKEPRELAGYKIITFSKTLFEMIIAAQENYGDDDIFDIEKGCDIVIKKSTDPKTHKVVWAANLRMIGRSVAETPLTEEELAIEMPNLLELSNKQISNEQIMYNLQDEYVEMINDPEFEQIIHSKGYKKNENSSNVKPTSTNDSVEEQNEDDVPF